jgi:hypothetical protein
MDLGGSISPGSTPDRCRRLVRNGQTRQGFALGLIILAVGFGSGCSWFPMRREKSDPPSKPGPVQVSENHSPETQSGANDSRSQAAVTEGERSGVKSRGWFGLPPLSELLDDDVEEDPNDTDDEKDNPRRPNIKEPGPDTANFPNSPYTIRQGRFYLEVSPLFLSGPSNGSPPTYNAEGLFRFGLTDRTEFRVFSNGLTAFRQVGRSRGSTGFSPLAFDLKSNLWKENKTYHIPAAGFEAFLQTNTGSIGFNQNTQVGFNLLFDHTLPYDVLFEWNVGIASDPSLRQTSVFEVVVQWAFQREIVEGFDIFYHGYLNGSANPRLGDGLVMGAGGIWTITQRFAVFGSYNGGITSDAPTSILQLGGAVAF